MAIAQQIAGHNISVACHETYWQYGTIRKPSRKPSSEVSMRRDVVANRKIALRRNRHVVDSTQFLFLQAIQKPSEPSPMASFGALERPKRFSCPSSSRQDWVLSR